MKSSFLSNWLRKHGACRDGHAWAVANCKTLADVWATARPDWLIWVATRPGVLTDREIRLFAVHCARSALARVASPDLRSVTAVDTSERFANGLATLEELAAARAAAHAAADAADVAASADARAAANAACHSAADAAAYVAAYAAADAATNFLSRSSQAAWLRANVTPNLSME
jgi:hypothetical protein